MFNSGHVSPSESSTLPIGRQTNIRNRHWSETFDGTICNNWTWLVRQGHFLSERHLIAGKEIIHKDTSNMVTFRFFWCNFFLLKGNQENHSDVMQDKSWYISSFLCSYFKMSYQRQWYLAIMNYNSCKSLISQRRFHRTNAHGPVYNYNTKITILGKFTL